MLVVFIERNSVRFSNLIGDSSLMAELRPVALRKGVRFSPVAFFVIRERIVRFPTTRQSWMGPRKEFLRGSPVAFEKVKYTQLISDGEQNDN